jgi:hypothetical protein
MIKPEFDENGEYPTQETLDYIRNWEVPIGEEKDWLLFCIEAMNPDYSSYVERDGIYLISTGGWSGNEDVFRAMISNPTGVWGRSFLCHLEGGHFVLTVSLKAGNIDYQDLRDYIFAWFNRPTPEETSK